MDDDLQWLRDKLDRMDSQLGDIRVAVVRMATAQEAAERRINDAEKRLDTIEQDLTPLRSIRWIGAALIVLAATVGAMKILGFSWDAPGKPQPSEIDK